MTAAPVMALQDVHRGGMSGSAWVEPWASVKDLFKSIGTAADYPGEDGKGTHGEARGASPGIGNTNSGEP